MKKIWGLLSSAFVVSALAACAPASRAPSSSDDIATGIIGGVDISQDNPIRRSVVGLYMLDKGAICTGTLVGSNLVLTAAHCISKQMVVVFKVSFEAAGKDDARPVTAAAVHPSYAANQMAPKDNGDIALVRFQGTVPAGYSPASVLPAAARAALKAGTLTMLIGYGQNNGAAGTGSGILRATSIRIQNPDFAATEVLLDQTQGRGACRGDSGGPAFVFLGGAAYVWGVTSRGESGCATDSIYTNAASYEGWLKDAANSLLR